MNLRHFFLVAACLAAAFATPASGEESHPVLSPQSRIMRGERMLPVAVPDRIVQLQGKAPNAPDGAPYRIISGQKVLWEGGPGESFRVEVRGLHRLYLLSGNGDLAWQGLQWHKGTPGSPQQEELTLYAADHGLVPGKGEAGPALRELLARSHGSQHTTIVLDPGEYHFHAKDALPFSVYVSNHDQQAVHPVGVPLVGLHNVTLRSEGARFVFHGKMLPVLIMDCLNTKLEGISIRHATPFSAEGRIVETAPGKCTLELDKATGWVVENGKFFNVGEGWKDDVCAAIAFEDDGRMVPLGSAGDLVWNARAEKLGDRRVLFHVDVLRRGLSKGNVLVLRSYWRPHPGLLIYRARNTSLKDVVFHDSMGMALIAQRSENIHIDGGGCLRHPGRYGTSGADATHFSNCKGHILVENALYEGMMDDAINVHATCLGIQEVHSPTEITCRYMHRQAMGFETFLPGEHVTFIRSTTLENQPGAVRIASVTKVDAEHLRLTLDAPLPEGIGAGDAVENADWHPSVTFRKNTVRHNRARGALFTTPLPVRVENNRFIWSSGSAILLAGDAQGWYESGRCLDVSITNNLFDHNLTCQFQFTDGIISICPEVKQPDRQQERYHRNIRIEGNTFRTHRVPLLSAISASDVSFRRNKVIYDNNYTPLHDGVPYRLLHCERMELQKVEAPRVRR